MALFEFRTAARPYELVNLRAPTYRLQFNREFTFADAARARSVSRAAQHQSCLRLADLKARPGSMHGYDVT
jgi:(1->4)-alpha-D-glucan 1-alpha-D-glucosylmutase